MTDPMELVRRLEMEAAHMKATPRTWDALTEAAACIREMVECLEMFEAELEVANLPTAPGAEA